MLADKTQSCHFYFMKNKIEYAIIVQQVFW